MLLDPTFNCHIYLSIRKDYVSYCDNHDGMKPEKIVMKTKIYDILDEIDIFGKDDVLSLWDIPVVQDDTIDTAWKFVGAPELRHHKCSFCGIVNSVNVSWHKLDDGFLCEDCYRMAHMGLEVDFVARGTRVEKHNKYMKYRLDKNYLKYYENYLFNTPVKSAYDD